MVAKRIGFIIKLVIPVVLLTYLFGSGIIDLRRLLEIQQWHLLVVALLLLALQMLLASWRWQQLLASQDIYANLRDTTQLTLIGMFFSIMLPGAMGGDLAKSYFVAKASPGKRAAAVSTVLLDRVIGLIALLCVAGLMFVVLWLAYPAVFSRFPTLQGLLYFFLLTLVGLLLSIVVLLSRRIRRWFRVELFIQRLPFAPSLLQIVSLLEVYRSKLGFLVHTFGIALLVQIITPLVFLLLSNAVNQENLPPYLLVLFVPLVMAINALPISFMGLGVGETAMIQLLAVVLPVGSTNLGGEMMILFRLLTIVLSLPGGVLWLSVREELSQASTQFPLNSASNTEYETKGQIIN